MEKGEFKRTIQQDLKDIYQFYLGRERRDRLSRMSRLRRWISISIWLIKSLMSKLVPVRRMLLIVSLILFFGFNVNYNIGNSRIDLGPNLFGFIILLIVLMLELKDKLLTRDELEAAHRIQLALLPEKSPHVPGWEVWLYTRPANEVGGDLIDFVELNHVRFGFSLGDVSGKGLGAALLMAKLQATIHALAPLKKGFEWLGSQLNQVFCRDCLPDCFASLIYLEVASNSSRVSLLNAGHLPPLVLCKDKLEELKRGDPALGLLSHTTYRKQRLELNPGNLVIVYSDGLTEARNQEDEFFGEERLKSFIIKCNDLSAEKVGDRLINEVDHFIGDASPSDDLSLVILKYIG